MNLAREARVAAGSWAMAALAASLGLGAAHAFGPREGGIALVAAALTAAGGRAALRLRGGPLRSDWLSVHPWGVAVEDESAPRVLRWAAIEAVEVTTRYARDGGSTSAIKSRVVLETRRERLVGATWGDAPLERLQAHFRAYAREQERHVAFDLDGRRAASDPFALQAASLVSEARAWLGAAEAVRRLGLSGGSYRRAAAPVATPDAIAALRAVLEARSWGDGERDARAFAAVCAGELAASSLVPSLLALTQSPHALVAAAARSAAARLGADRQRTGALEELERFLAPEDLAVFVEWAAPPTHALG